MFFCFSKCFFVFQNVFFVKTLSLKNTKSFSICQAWMTEDKNILMRADAVVDVLQQSYKIEHESHIAARKSEDATREDLRKANATIEAERKEHESWTTGKSRNNPRTWRKALQLIENIDFCGPFDDDGTMFSKAILEAIQAGKLCDGVRRHHIPCNFEAQKIEATMQRKIKASENPKQRKRKLNENEHKE